jgi:hypothetical protein
MDGARSETGGQGNPASDSNPYNEKGTGKSSSASFFIISRYAFSIYPETVSIIMRSYNLYIQIPDLAGMRGNEPPPWCDFIAHQHIEGPVGQDRVLDRHLQERTHAGIHRRFP